MNEVVFDSSALLALILQKPGGQLDDLLPKAVISSVNFVEVLTKLIDLDRLDATILGMNLRTVIRVEPFTEAQASIAAQLRPATRHLGLSLGDRACLALAISTKCEVYTSDSRWAEAQVEIRSAPDPLAWRIVSENDRMPIYQVIVLAMVQGLAELLPVSSSAHVVVAEKLMGWIRPVYAADDAAAGDAAYGHDVCGDCVLLEDVEADLFLRARMRLQRVAVGVIGRPC